MSRSSTSPATAHDARADGPLLDLTAQFLENEAAFQALFARAGSRDVPSSPAESAAFDKIVSRRKALAQKIARIPPVGLEAIRAKASCALAYHSDGKGADVPPGDDGFLAFALARDLAAAPAPDPESPSALGEQLAALFRSHTSLDAAWLGAAAAHLSWADGVEAAADGAAALAQGVGLALLRRPGRSAADGVFLAATALTFMGDVIDACECGGDFAGTAARAVRDGLVGLLGLLCDLSGMTPADTGFPGIARLARRHPDGVGDESQRRVNS